MPWSWVAPAVTVGAALLGGSEASSSGGSATTTVDKAPWGTQVPYLEQLFRDAQSKYNANQLSGVAGFTPLETEGQNFITNYARSVAPGVATGTTDAYQRLLGASQGPAANPALAQYIQAAMRPLSDDFSENVLRNIRNNSVATGYGSTRQGVAEGIAAGKYANAQSDLISKIINDAYYKGSGISLEALGRAPQVTAMGIQPGQLLTDIGAQGRALEQSRLELPYSNMSRYSGLVTGNYGGSQATQAPGTRTNPLFGVMSGLTTGAAASGILKDIFSGGGSSQYPTTPLDTSGSEWAGLGW